MTCLTCAATGTNECEDMERVYMPTNLEAVDELMSLRAKSRRLSCEEDRMLLELQQIIILRADIDRAIDQIESERDHADRH